MKITLSYFKIIGLVLFVSFEANIFAQSQRNSVNNDVDQEEVKNKAIPPSVKTWLLRDDFTFCDTVAVDTLSTGFQIYNSVYKTSISNAYLGNTGSAYISNIYDDRVEYNGFLFYNTLMAYMHQPEKFNFYNTKTPYVNLGYHSGSPKRRSEEAVRAFYTQNVNKNWNIGFEFLLRSSIGRYDAQKTDNQNLSFFSSYNGKRYGIHGLWLLTDITNFENGGINPRVAINGLVDFDQPEDVPVFFQTAQNAVKSNRLFLTQSLNIGSVSHKGKDSVTVKLPISTVYWSTNMNSGSRVYSIDNLANYYKRGYDSAYYKNVYTDSLKTRDTSQVFSINNTFQIKFNEEANSFLKFGLRAFISNDILRYNYQTAPLKYDKVNLDYIPHYQLNDTLLTTTAIGGQIFKNLGRNFWWNAGLKFYFQGYRLGDTELQGKLNSQFKLGGQTAGFFASGGLYLQEPEFFQNNYYSNHIKWENTFNKQKSIKANGGIRLVDKRFELSGGIDLLNDLIYWSTDGTPQQSSQVVQVYRSQVKEHFIINKIHSDNTLVAQVTSNDQVLPLPLFSYFSSNYYQNVLFDVLNFQIGTDIRYHSAFFAPYYMPATSQFTNQSSIKIGNYVVADLFLNILLKRARVYVKIDHVNQGFTNDAYYNSVLYPANPRSFKFGVSWNFYD